MEALRLKREASGGMPGDQIQLRSGGMHVEITPQPFAFTVRRRGRRLLRDASVWAAEGTIHDQFLSLTEGVIAREDLEPHEPAQRVTAIALDDDGRGATLELALHGGRAARLRIAIGRPEQVSIELTAAGAPLRLALEWDRRSDEHVVGLGARHCTQFDQVGRTIQLGADRRYTGPDCPPEMLAIGGVPQGDCAPVPWLNSSRGYAAWIRTGANGTRIDLSGSRISASTRAAAGPLAILFLTASTPAARLRAFCALTGWPAVLPEWGYGFWKSRDFHEHQDDVEDDLTGFRRHRIPLDAIVIDSPWATQYNTWQFNPHQFPDAPGMVRELRTDGVRTVLWCTPWVNLDSSDGQIPPQAESERLHRAPASNYAEGAARGHYVKLPDGTPYVTRWWMGSGSPIDFSSAAAEAWWREQVKDILRLGVEGIKMDDGDGFYLADHAVLADGRSGAEAAWELGSLHRVSLQRALDEVHPGRGVLFGRSGWSGQQAIGHTWGGDQVSDFWSLRVLVAATLSAAASGMSNWSHDVGGYLGHRLVERCHPELLVRWLQFGCFTPLMHAHSKMPQEPWNYGEDVTSLYREYVLLHEQLVPYVRAAAATAARTGLPIIRPLCLTDPTDPRGWTVADAYGYGPALWVAPVLDEGAAEREVALPNGRWIETWSGRQVAGGSEVLAPAPLSTIPVWVRSGSIVVTYPAEHVARGLGDDAESGRPLVATLWGEPPLGHTGVLLADGTKIAWSRGAWRASPDREITYVVR
jgi:alpha-glucosidase (family GH31 glycosyl hydrolase)